MQLGWSLVSLKPRESFIVIIVSRGRHLGRLHLSLAEYNKFETDIWWINQTLSRRFLIQLLGLEESFLLPSSLFHFYITEYFTLYLLLNFTWSFWYNIYKLLLMFGVEAVCLYFFCRDPWLVAARPQAYIFFFNLMHNQDARRQLLVDSSRWMSWNRRYGVYFEVCHFLLLLALFQHSCITFSPILFLTSGAGWY